MKIAQVSPLFESVPPKLYGGTERIVFHLTEELVKCGHDVTLYASGDSLTSASLIAPCTSALRLNTHYLDPMAYHMLMLGQLTSDAHQYDIIHFHTDYLHYPLIKRLPTPAVTTLHGRLDLPDLKPLYEMFTDVNVVSISDNQRRPLPYANWQATVYHGLPQDLYTFQPRPGDYLAFLGRISPEKRPDRAIEIAKRTGIKLKIAAKVDAVDRMYYEQILPLMDHPLIEFIGEIDEPQKNSFLGGARALLFPIDWPEPFGLAMIEAMACGTPVIAFRNGSVPEIIDHGISGFIVDDIDQAIQAVGLIETLDRASCRRMFEQRFSAKTMAAAYINLYREIITNTSEYNRQTYGPFNEKNRNPDTGRLGAIDIAAG